MDSLHFLMLDLSSFCFFFFFFNDTATTEIYTLSLHDALPISAAEIASSPTRNVGEQPGDLRYVDTNGDKTITDADKQFLGCPIPDVVYGFNGRLRFGDFDVSANFSGQAGKKVFNRKKAVRLGGRNFQASD